MTFSRDALGQRSPIRNPEKISVATQGKHKQTGVKQSVAKTSEGPDSVKKNNISVPFCTLSELILRRRVQLLPREWQNHPVSFSPELLAQIAHAPNGANENRSMLVFMLGVIGFCLGMMLAVVTLTLFPTSSIAFAQRAVLISTSVVAIAILLVFLTEKVRAYEAKQRFLRHVERIAHTN